MSPEQVAELRRLLAAAGPGEAIASGPLVYSLTQHGFWHGEPCFVNRWELIAQSAFPEFDEKALAALTAAAINALPALLDAAEERDRLRAADVAEQSWPAYCRTHRLTTDADEED